MKVENYESRCNVEYKHVDKEECILDSSELSMIEKKARRLTDKVRTVLVW